MPCQRIKIGDSMIIACSRGGRRPPVCFYCKKPSEALCDFPVKKLKTKWKTCDRHLCRGHAKKGVSENVDFCREHYPMARAAYERRQAKKSSLFKES